MSTTGNESLVVQVKLGQAYGVAEITSNTSAVAILHDAVAHANRRCSKALDDLKQQGWRERDGRHFIGQGARTVGLIQQPLGLPPWALTNGGAKADRGSCAPSVSDWPRMGTTPQ